MRRSSSWASQALWATGALCALALGAWAGGPAQVAPRGETEPLRVADELAVGGAPLELSVFFTPDLPGQVLGFYAAAVERQGLLPIAAQERDLATVSVFEPGTGLFRTMTALRVRPTETLVVLSALEAREIPRLVRGIGQFGLPLPDDRRGLVALRGVDGGAASETAHFVSARSPAEVLGFFREGLAKMGFRAAIEGGSQLELVRGEERVTIAAQALGREQGAAVFVAHTGGAVR